MDDPDLDAVEHFQALQGLSRLNRVSGSSRIVWKPIRELSQRLGTDRLRILDIGTGAGDVLIGLWKYARRFRLQLELRGTDISERAIRYATESCTAVGADITYSRLDALEDPLPEGYDVTITSLFLHHLSEEDARRLLVKMATATQHLVLVNDLRRCHAGLFLANTAGRLLTRSRVVHADGPRSVRAAFSPVEMRELADRAGLRPAFVTRHWPCRMLCEWQKGSDWSSERPTPTTIVPVFDERSFDCGKPL